MQQPPGGYGPPPSQGYGPPSQQQHGPPGYHVPGFPPQGYPPPKQNSGKATLAMWLGIASFVTCGFSGIPALILGLMGKKEIDAEPQRHANGGQALAGIVLGALGCVFVLLTVAAMVAPGNEEASTAAAESAAPSASSAVAAAPTVTAAATAPEGSSAAAAATASAATATSGSWIGHTKLEQLVQHAMRPDAIQAIVGKNEWAFYRPGTTDCYDRGNPDVNLTLPEADDEYQAHDLQAQRREIRTAAVGKLVRFEGEGSVGVQGGTLGDLVVTPKYDFRRKALRLTIELASTDPPWPLGRTDPVFAADTATLRTDREIGKIGGKSLTVKGTETLTNYEDSSKMTVTVPMAEKVAEQHKDSMKIRVLVVEKFVGLGFHKVCKQECSTILGVYSCSNINVGVGKYYRASPVGYEVYVEGRLAAQKQPN